MTSVFRATKWAIFASFGLACGGVVTGCSSAARDPGSSEHEDTEAPCLGTSTAELKTCATGSTLRGVDVSSYQGNVNWTKVKGAGQSFAFVRVSDGIDHPDATFAQNWPGVKAVGIVRGVYQYFRPAKDVDAQVDLLVSKVAAAGGLVEGDLPPVLDLESDGGLPASTVVARAKAWLAKVEAEYGVKPIVYTAAFMSNIIGDAFGGYKLWVANYQTSCPTMPSGWSDWHFWQDSEEGTVAGITGPVDTNHFNGTLTALGALTLKVASVPVPVSGDPPPTNEAIAAVLGEDQGATIGSSKSPTSTPFTPCK